MADTYHHLTTADSAVDVKFKWQPRMSLTVEVPATTLDFDGREHPLGYFGEGANETGDHEFTNDVDSEGDMWAEMRRVVDGDHRGEVLTWADTFGNTISVIVPSATWSPIVSPGKRLRQIRFRFLRVE